jgi:RNA polymerase sigma-70 factor (ECF subfamily)
MLPRPERVRANDAMERYARGEHDAFAQLYDALAPMLHRYLVGACRDRSWADDLLQQTMLNIHRARGRFLVGGDVVPWAFAIARRLLIDGVRRRKRERGVISLETGGREGGPFEAASERLGADELVDSKRLAHALEVALGRLPTSQRRAFELLKHEELSIRETALVMGATSASVKLRAHRAYIALRNALRERGGRQTGEL